MVSVNCRRGRRCRLERNCGRLVHDSAGRHTDALCEPTKPALGEVGDDFVTRLEINDVLADGFDPPRDIDAQDGELRFAIAAVHEADEERRSAQQVPITSVD